MTTNRNQPKIYPSWDDRLPNFSEFSIPVTIPALPSQTTSAPEPTVTASAYLNSSSPTGRTLAVIANNFSLDYPNLPDDDLARVAKQDLLYTSDGYLIPNIFLGFPKLYLN